MRPPNKSRSRKNNRRNNNNSGGNSLNRVYDSAGPDGRVRGTPVQVIEKYQALAHDYSLAGDRVATENCQQHAEHYIRLINEVQRQIAERREQTDNQASNSDRNRGGSQPQNDPGQGSQPNVDMAQTPAENRPAPNKQKRNESPFDEGHDLQNGDANGGLVETPENVQKPAKAAKQSKPRAPRKPKVTTEAPDAPATDQPATE